MDAGIQLAFSFPFPFSPGLDASSIQRGLQLALSETPHRQTHSKAHSITAPLPSHAPLQPTPLPAPAFASIQLLCILRVFLYLERRMYDVRLHETVGAGIILPWTGYI